MTRRKATGRRAPAELGSVEQLPSGRWRAFYRWDGRKYAAPSTFATKAEGRIWIATENADRARGIWQDPTLGRTTLATFSESWIRSRPDLRPRTVDLYQRVLGRWILPRIGAGTGSSRGVALGPMNLVDITPATVRTWFAAVHSASAESARRRYTSPQKGGHPARQWALSQGIPVAATGRISPAVISAWQDAGAISIESAGRAPQNAGRTTAAQAYRLLRAILGTAAHDGLIASNPCRIKGGGSVTHRERGTATLAELDGLASHMPAHLVAAVRVAAWSGLRYGELFGLSRSHISPDARALKVMRSLENVPGRAVSFGAPKTASSVRTVHIPRKVAEELQAHMDTFTGAGAEALIFSMPDGSPVANVHLSRAFRAARQAIGRDDLTWHDLRHTGATLAYAAGASIPDVQRRLGHSTIRAAQVYAHSSHDADRLLADRLDLLTTSAKETH